MRISGFELYRYTLPLTGPLTLGGATLSRREGILLRLFADGEAEGWGEASPLPGFSRESLEEVVGQLHDFVPRLLDREVTVDWPEVGADPLAPSVRFAVELAVCNLLAAASGSTLPDVLSPSAGKKVRVNALLDGPPEYVLEEARRVREAGYRAFKLKVGSRDVREDAALVRELRDLLGGGAILRLDANRAWGYEEATEFARAVAGTGFEYVEEPLADAVRLPGLVRETGLPVALDESLAGMEPEDLGRHPHARAVVLKPTLIGGISRALRFAGEAERLGMRSVVSAAYETGVGTAALVALAAAIGGGRSPAGLDTYRRLADDVVSPRLELPAPEVDARAACAPRGISGRLTPAG